MKKGMPWASPSLDACDFLNISEEGPWGVAPRPRNYTVTLCNPQAMLHNRRLLGYHSQAKNFGRRCSEWIIGNATLRSCHEHWHSYQGIIERSRLRNNWHFTDSTTQRDHRATHIIEKDSKRHIRGHRPIITTSGSKYSCLTTRSKLWPKRPTDKHPMPACSNVPSCHLGTPNYSSMST